MNVWRQGTASSLLNLLNFICFYLSDPPQLRSDDGPSESETVISLKNKNH